MPFTEVDCELVLM